MATTPPPQGTFAETIPPQDIFAKILANLNLGTQALGAAAPAISEYGQDHVASLQGIVGVAGATAATALKDPNQQAEAIAAAQTAQLLIPFIFGFFHKKASAPKV